jgi:type II secretory pathway predicted ATPase ExeA
LLQAILFDLNQPYRGLSEQELRLAVTDRILAGAAAGHPTVMVIDEAQHLGPAALEDLRLLGNIETPDGSALLLVLVAQPSFREMLTRPGVEAFSQRLGVRCRIEPFTADESAAYLRHQVRIAGGEPAEVLDDEAVAVIAGACGGVARVLNQAASLAAELAVGVGAEMIDVEAALEAIHALGLSSSTAEGAEDLVTLPHPGQAARPIEEQPSTGREAAIRDDPRAVRGPKQKTGRKRSA